MVREVSVDKSGKPNGIIYISKDDNKEYKISAKVVVLAASACESARILLNSKSPYHVMVLVTVPIWLENIYMIQQEQTIWHLFQI